MTDPGLHYLPPDDPAFDVLAGVGADGGGAEIPDFLL